MVEIQLAYEGNLRTSAIHEPSGTRLITDAPRDNQGQGESFSPTDLVATALGSCMLTIMGIAARNFKIDLTGATVRVQKEMITQPVRRIGKLTVEITVPKPLSADDQRRLRDAAMHCPVHKSLHPDVEIPVTFSFADMGR
ncbi:MAG TPA: OsmC family protein [Tepidisphaeraceae bacterium]|jgi:putative redox protein|nr:OsmC family protein [Tepidisphaeraceae bacterium]